MTLVDEIERIAARLDGGGDVLTGILPAEAMPGARAYLCAFEAREGERTWLVLGADGDPVRDRRGARDAVSIAALCEVAQEAAFPGDLDELRAQLVALRLTESPAGIEEAEAAALALQHTLGSPPQLATPMRLDEIGTAAQRLERALDASVASPFSAAMRTAQAVVEALWAEVESSYRGELV